MYEYDQDFVKMLIRLTMLCVPLAFVMGIVGYIFADCLHGCVVHGGVLGHYFGMEGLHIR